MAEYYEDFSGYAIGSVPNGYTFPWSADGSVMSVESENPVASSDRRLEVTQATGNFTRVAVKWDAGECSGKTTVRARLNLVLRLTNPTRTVWIPGSLVNGSGSSQATRTGYSHWGGVGGVRISRANNGTDTTLANVSGATWPSNERVDFFAEIIRDGSSIEVRRWLAGDSRPETASASATDASALSESGFFGLALLSGSTSNVAALPAWVYEIGVGTDGDPAPTGPLGTTEAFALRHNPRTNKVIPVLSSPTVTDIGANCVRPRVTKGF